MKTLALAAGLAASLFATAAEAMTVQEFLTAAARIPRNPTALLRSDTRRLMNEVKGGFAAVRREQVAARTAGRTPPTCMPERVSLSPDDILGRFNAIPAARRSISVDQAIREWMVERYPCPR
ncbi:MAG: hypothetical protein H2038_11425 [Brevundimonas sp.]|jgi:hypothetical protein|uniref:hypothetical protein n=1 Tax=Brevundimonas sp. TaxID=1871086 RepID=UPI00185D18BE|nr:hypothetical protein [Brevundimonas sp.]MBA4805253.1 hypothetical protein [Brevundimonas sp.]